MSADHLAALYGRLRYTVQAAEPLVTTTQPAATEPEPCRHPRSLERIDDWDEDDQADNRFEHHVVRTVCIGCDTTTGYTRTKRAKKRARR